MVTFLIILFVLVCVAMVIAILLQSSKGQGLAGTFGGTGASAVFGGRGAATFLSKTTTVLAVSYMILCLLIGYFYKRETDVARESLIQQETETESTLPVTGVPIAPIEPTSGDTIR
jgi:preprotein translocase subunit SecG